MYVCMVVSTYMFACTYLFTYFVHVPIQDESIMTLQVDEKLQEYEQKKAEKEEAAAQKKAENSQEDIAILSVSSNSTDTSNSSSITSTSSRSKRIVINKQPNVSAGI